MAKTLYTIFPTLTLSSLFCRVCLSPDVSEQVDSRSFMSVSQSMAACTASWWAWWSRTLPSLTPIWCCWQEDRGWLKNGLTLKRVYISPILNDMVCLMEEIFSVFIVHPFFYLFFLGFSKTHYKIKIKLIFDWNLMYTAIMETNIIPSFHHKTFLP